MHLPKNTSSYKWEIEISRSIATSACVRSLNIGIYWPKAFVIKPKGKTSPGSATVFLPFHFAFIAHLFVHLATKTSLTYIPQTHHWLTSHRDAIDSLPTKTSLTHFPQRCHCLTSHKDLIGYHPTKTSLAIIPQRHHCLTSHKHVIDSLPTETPLTHFPQRHHWLTFYKDAIDSLPTEMPLTHFPQRCHWLTSHKDAIGSHPTETSLAIIPQRPHWLPKRRNSPHKGQPIHSIKHFIAPKKVSITHLGSLITLPKSQNYYTKSILTIIPQRPHSLSPPTPKDPSDCYLTIASLSIT